MCTPYLCNIILFRNAYLLIKIISPVYSATVVVRANQRARTTRVTAVVAFQHPAAMAGGTAATRSAACGRRAAHVARATVPAPRVGGGAANVRRRQQQQQQQRQTRSPPPRPPHHRHTGTTRRRPVSRPHTTVVRGRARRSVRAKLFTDILVHVYHNIIFYTFVPV